MSDIIGTGIAFPLRVDRLGGLALSSSGDTDVQEAIDVILGTAPGERPMRPEFGCGIHNHVFDDDRRLHARRRSSTRSARRSTAGSRGSTCSTSSPTCPASTTGVLIIDITYRLRATNDMRNLVYPFYLIPAEPE